METLSLVKNGIILPKCNNNKIEVGQIVWLNGYGQSEHSHENQVVTKENYSNFGTSYTCVNIEKLTIRQHSHIRPASEIFGIGIYYNEGEFYNGNIEELLLRAIENEKQLKEKIKIGAQKEAIEKKELIEALKKEYSFLELSETSKKSHHALGASNLKKHLKKVFPSVAFTVKSETYSGGNSINVHYADAMPEQEVDKIVDLYQTKSFDGMQDLETYRNNTFAEVFGGAGYTFVNRHIDLKRYIEVGKKLGYDVVIDENYNWNLSWNEKQVVERETYKTSFLNEVQP